MYIFENAARNLLRNKGRNALLAGIIWVVIAAVVVSLMIQNTATKVIADAKAKYGSAVTFSPNREKVQAAAEAESDGSGRVRMQMPQIAAAQYIAFGESAYLQSAVYTASARANSADLIAVDVDKGGGGSMNFRASGPGGNGGTAAESQGTQYYHKLLAGQVSEFEDGSRVLAEGTYAENDNECIISTDLLAESGKSIGDTIVVTSNLTSSDAAPDDNAAEIPITYTLKIVGTYTDMTEEYNSNGFGAQENAYENRRNEILTTFNTVIAPMQDGTRGITVGAAFTLNNPDDLEAFAAEVRAKGLDEKFDVTTDSTSYTAAVGPIENLKKIAVTFMIVVLVFGGVILALLSSIAIRERKYEIGVLRAMGMKKGKVSLGLWSEMVILTALCLMVGVGTGVAAAQPISSALLTQQTAANETADTGGPGGMGMPGGNMRGEFRGAGGGPISIMNPGAAATNVEAEDLHVKLDLRTVGEIAGIAFLLASFAALFSIARITQYEPIKILMERN